MSLRTPPPNLPLRRVAAGLLLCALVALTPSGAAVAHGFGQRYTLPVPLWLYLYGAAATVVLSFLLIGFFVGEAHAPDRYRTYNLLQLRLFRFVFASKPFLLLLRVVSVGLFLLVLLTGFFGVQEPAFNFAPTFVWVIWWVGLSIFTALVGNIWPLVNPWQIVFEWVDGLARRLGLREGLELHVAYPARLGAWPALALYAVFVWTEIVFEGSPTPLNIASLALLYSVITWGGMAVFGKDVWLRQGEAFSVFFDILGKFAPTEVRVTNPAVCKECSGDCWRPDGECIGCYECFAWAGAGERQVNLRPPAVGLSRSESITVDRLAFIVFMLASVTLDGLFVTTVWIRLENWIFPPTEIRSGTAYLLFMTLAILVLPVLFMGIYYAFSLLIRIWGGSSVRLGQVAAAFVLSLVPIALAYQVAHYYTLLLIQGQGIFALISDPFGFGWNLFGTAENRVNVGILGAVFVWYSQVTLIVVGHVIAVYLAHVIALRLLRNPKRAIRSQYPMLALMVLYTISSLWIISQPIVEENRAGNAPGPAARMGSDVVREARMGGL